MSTDVNLNNLFKGNAFSFKNAKCPTVSGLTTSVILPSLSMGTTEVPFSALRAKTPGSILEYGELLVTFNLDENWVAYFEVYDWLMLMRDPTKENHEDFVVDSSIVIYDNANQAIIDISFRDCFPTNLDDIPFSTSEADNVSMSVTFEFDYFDVKRITN
jgi:hypothetical protein